MATEEQITTAIKSALRAVDEASVPEDLRAPAFEKAFEALTQAVPSNGGASHGDASAPASAGGGPGSADIAARLRVDPQALERVLDIDDQGVHVIVQRSRLAKSKAAAHQQVAGLIVGGLTAAGRDNDGWVPQAAVRQATEELGVDDPSNFASHMKKLDGFRVRGTGKTGELKMNAVGLEAVSALITALSSDPVKN